MMTLVGRKKLHPKFYVKLNRWVCPMCACGHGVWLYISSFAVRSAVFVGFLFGVFDAFRLLSVVVDSIYAVFVDSVFLLVIYFGIGHGV